jgi:hypothetical protein
LSVKSFLSLKIFVRAKKNVLIFLHSLGAKPFLFSFTHTLCDPFHKQKRSLYTGSMRGDGIGGIETMRETKAARKCHFGKKAKRREDMLEHF